MSPTERLRVVREWAERYPYSGIHDAPEDVRKALGYKGVGAQKLKERLDRRFNGGTDG